MRHHDTRHAPANGARTPGRPATADAPRLGQTASCGARKGVGQDTGTPAGTPLADGPPDAWRVVVALRARGQDAPPGRFFWIVQFVPPGAKKIGQARKIGRKQSPSVDHQPCPAWQQQRADRCCRNKELL